MNDSMMSSIYLTRNDIDRLKFRKIGEGKDAEVFDVGRGLLYKIYKSDTVSELPIRSPKGVYDAYGVRIATKGMVRFEAVNVKPKTLDYIDSNGVKLHSVEAIRRACLKQLKIQKTSLPLAPIFIDNRFKGCVIKNHKRHIQLHKIWGVLPNKERLYLLKMICTNVKELCDNGIYHLDLANKSTGETATALSHSNILVSLKLIPQIIDIDGQSAVYREKSDSILEELSYQSLNTLLLELLFDLDLEDDMVRDDAEYIGKLLEKKGVPSSLATNLMNGSSGKKETNELLDLTFSKKLKL